MRLPARPDLGSFIIWKMSAVAALQSFVLAMPPAWLRSELRARYAPGMAAREAGGAYRDRTDDLKLAKLALSQLS